MQAATASDYFAGYEATIRASLELAADVSRSDLGRTTPCPDWTLFDQYAHLESVDAWFLGEPLPLVDVSNLTYAATPFAVTMEKLAESRRDRPFERILSDIAGHLETWRRRVLDLEDEPSATWAAPMGPSSPERVLGIRLFDTWIHEQDIRETLDRPGPLDTFGARYAVGRLLTAWPSIVARAGLAAGTVIGLTVTGESRARTAARVVTRPDGPSAEPADPDSASTVITAATHAATRLAAGRRSLGEPYRWTWTGDEPAARAVVDAMPITP